MYGLWRYSSIEDLLFQKKIELIHIVKNDFVNRSDFISSAQLLGLFDEKKKIIILLQYKVGDKDKSDERFERIWNQCLGKYRFPKGISIISAIFDNNFIILADYAALDIVIDVLTETADLITGSYKIGIGDPFEKAEYLPISYREAYEAILHCRPDQTINTFCEETKEDAEQLKQLTEFNSKIIDALENGKSQDMPYIVSDFFTIIIKCEPDQAFNFCLSSINSVIEYFGIDNYEQFKIKYRFDLIGPSVKEIIYAIRATYMDNIVRIMDIIDNMKGSPAEYVIKQVQEIVLNSYSKQDLSLFEISRNLHISYGYLSKLVKQKMGVSFVHYLTSVRMSNAKKLLFDGGMKVYEIAKAVGFNSSGYFITAFKKHYGSSPSSFRERCKTPEE